MPFFAGASEDGLARMAARARWLVRPVGAVVLDTGQASDDVYFVIEGALRVVVLTAQGYEAILSDLGRGDFFGELAAIDGGQRSANVTALLNTGLCVVPGAVFMGLVLTTPVVAQRLLSMLATRVRAKVERLLEPTTLPVRQRPAAELLRLPRDRSGGERSISPPPHQVLASRVGIRRETVSRGLAKISRLGLVTVGHRAIILRKSEVLQAEVDAGRRGSGDP